jgi:flagellin
MASLNLDANTKAESTDIERLSTGLKINSAADDPAGLVTSEDESAQLAGLNQATSNSNDAINLTQTAEGALNQVQTLLVSMRQLAVAASQTGTNNSTELAADQQQINSAIQSINNISSTTQFNNDYLLNGAASSATTTSPSTAVIANAATGTSVINTGTWAANTAVNNANATASAGTAQAWTIAAGSAGVDSAGDIGGSVTIGGTVYQVGDGTHSENVSTFNAQIEPSGWSAAVSGTGALVFTSLTSGNNSNAISASSLFTAATAGAVTPGAGVALAAGAGAQSTAGVAASLAVAGYGTSTSEVTTGNTTAFTFANGLQINTAAGASGVVGTLTSTVPTSTSGNNLEFQIGANEGQTVSLAIQSTAANQLGTNTAAYTNASGATVTPQTANVGAINVTTFQGAQDAIAVLDQAINQVSTIRANLGAFQTNVLQSNVTSLGVATTNLQAAQATTQDTDMASQVVDYTKNSILVQAATSALTYANQEPQSILKLLQ